MFELLIASAVTRLRQAEEKGLLVKFGLIGGFAVSRWGVIRATSDIDFFVALGESDPRPLADFLGGSFRKGTIDDPLLCSITFLLKDELGEVPVQLLQFPPAWETVAVHDLHEEVAGSLTLPIVDWKALVLLKLYAGGAHDLEDAKGVLAAADPNKRDLEYLKKKAASLRISRRLARLEG